VGPKEKQATFTGREQRRGVYVIPVAVPGVFKLVWQPRAPVTTAGHAEHAADEQPDAEQDDLEEVPADAGGYEADDDEAAAGVNKDFKFDWPAYHRAFGNKPFDEAVTAMFVEYAALYQRMAGYAGATFPKPMTLNEARSIQEQAERFVTSFVTPLLGAINSTKVHRLLCHVFEAIRDHGHLRNMNTAANECKHKEDKAHYVHTNRDPKAYTRQLVRHAQGSRLVKANLDRDAVASKVARRGARAAAALVAADNTGAPSHDGATRSKTASDILTYACGTDDSSDDESGCGSTSAGSSSDADYCSEDVDAEGSGNTGAVQSGGQTATAKRAYHLDATTIASLAERPGLMGAAGLLKLPPNTVVRVSKSLVIEARFGCGTKQKQTVWGTPDYRGSEWYDAVLFQAGKHASRVRVGEVRALVRMPEGDVALVVEMVPVEAVPGCPLSLHGCLRLRWNIRDSETECVAREVPLHRIRRLIHVVPDFADLAERRGYEAAPASPYAPLPDRRDMCYFLNALYPWDAS